MACANLSFGVVCGVVVAGTLIACVFDVPGGRRVGDLTRVTRK